MPFVQAKGLIVSLSIRLGPLKLTPSAIVGGGVADANSHRGKHKGSDGRWHDDAFEERQPFERVGVPPVDREVETPWDFAAEAVVE